jgi:hypothetical protein
MKRLWLLVTMLGGLLPAVIGCGDATQKVYKTTGTLVFEDDGKPAAKAPLGFAPATALAEGQRSPFAMTDENGKFELSTYGDKDGAPAGDYTVFIDPISASRGAGGAGKPPTMPSTSSGPPGTAMATAASPYAKEYLSSGSSPLKVTIKSGGGDLGELKIKRNPGAAKP